MTEEQAIKRIAQALYEKLGYADDWTTELETAAVAWQEMKAIARDDYSIRACPACGIKANPRAKGLWDCPNCGHWWTEGGFTPENHARPDQKRLHREYVEEFGTPA